MLPYSLVEKLYTSDAVDAEFVRWANSYSDTCFGYLKHKKLQKSMDNLADVILCIQPYSSWLKANDSLSIFGEEYTPCEIAMNQTLEDLAFEYHTKPFCKTMPSYYEHIKSSLSKRLVLPFIVYNIPANYEDLLALISVKAFATSGGMLEVMRKSLNLRDIELQVHEEQLMRKYVKELVSDLMIEYHDHIHSLLYNETRL